MTASVGKPVGPTSTDPARDDHAAGSELTAAFDVSRPRDRVAHPLFSALQADALRALLMAEMRERVTELAQQATRLAVLTINFIGDGLRDALDPRRVL